ncbi:tetracycline resistance efflux system leader peptide [Lysinibacillus fusiformis]|nr:tetracycline resistance efflux system leader peptide [Lysinibacillus fusiformis]
MNISAIIKESFLGGDIMKCHKYNWVHLMRESVSMTL